MKFEIRIATSSDAVFVPSIIKEIAFWAKFRSTGVTNRTEDYLLDKIEKGVVLMAFDESGDWVGFSYLETWKHGRYVANSGLIVRPQYRNIGLSLRLKQAALRLAAQQFPEAKVFSLTTSLSVAKLNLELGYRPVSHDVLLEDKDFMNGCGDLLNFPKMVETHQGDTECFTMVFDPILSRLRKVS